MNISTSAVDEFITVRIPKEQGEDKFLDKNRGFVDKLDIMNKRQQLHNPKVSVIMSVYNGEKYVKNAIESILNQTFEDFEFIIINDGSTDKTKEILEGFKDMRLFIMHQENSGLTLSLNNAIELSRGEYIARMDADDISLPQRFELQVKFLDENKDIAVVGSHYYIIDDQDRIIDTRYVICEPELIQEALLTSCQFGHGTVMIRKNVLNEVGYYNPEAIHVEDYELWLRMAENFKMSNLDTILYKWRSQENQIARKYQKEQQKYTQIIRQLAKKRRNVSVLYQPSKQLIERIGRKRLSEIYFELGIISIFANEELHEAKNQLFISMKYNPWNIKTYPYLCLALLPLNTFRLIRICKQKICKLLNIGKKIG